MKFLSIFFGICLDFLGHFLEFFRICLFALGINFLKISNVLRPQATVLQVKEIWIRQSLSFLRYLGPKIKFYSNFNILHLLKLKDLNQ